MKRPAIHGRGANNSGHIRVVRLATGEARYHALLRNVFLGSFETRARALRAIEDAKGVKQSAGGRGDDVA
jgi:hypothetical protein